MTMALIAAVAAMIASVLDQGSPLSGLVTLTVTLALPVHFMVRAGRCSTFEEMSAATLAMAYLMWGALFGFRPGTSPGYWFVLYTMHWADYGSARWNWGLLAAFYAAILLLAITPPTRKWLGRVSSGESTRPPDRSMRSPPGSPRIAPAAELVPALWFFCSWVYGSRYFGPMGRWLCPAGIIGSLALLVVDWRPRPPSWRLSRFFARVARLVPATAAGLITGLAWSQWGWGSSARTAAAFVVMVVLVTRLSIYRRRGRTLLHFSRLSSRRWRGRVLVQLLAMFWGFAISAEILPPLRPWIRTQGSSPVLSPRSISSHVMFWGVAIQAETDENLYFKFSSHF